MALRCFARRALVPARRPIVRRTPELAHPLQAFSAAAAVNKGKAPEYGVRPTWFESNHSFFADRPKGTPAKEQATRLLKGSGVSSPSSSTDAKVKPLLEALAGRNTPIDYIWSVYLAATEKQTAAPLTGPLHREVLLAIAPGRNAGVAQTQIFIDRAAHIFSQMRQDSIRSSLGSFFTKSYGDGEGSRYPALYDYNLVLSKAAAHGRLSTMLGIWQQMQMRSDGVQPSADTFELLMHGLYRHTAAQVARIDPVAEFQAAEKPLPHVNKHTLRAARNKATLAAMASTQMQHSDSATQARRVASLASQRCFSLLFSMHAQGAAPTSKTLDMAARLFRLSGDMEALRRLLREFFAVDFASFDAPIDASPGARALNTHVLLTTLMALGEFRTVPQMVAAYETFSRPLPTLAAETAPLPAGWLDQEDDGILSVASQPEDSAAQNAPESSLFKLDWTALSRKDDPEHPSMAGTPSKPIEYSSPRQVQPTTKMFTTMVQHTLTPVDIERVAVLASSERGVRRAALRVSAEEQQRRRSGQYLLLAKSMLNEVLELVQESTDRIERHAAASANGSQTLDSAVVEQHLLPATEMLAPVFAFASRTASTGLLKWIDAWAARARQTMQAQGDLLRQLRAARSDSARGAHFVRHLDQQLAFLQRTEEDLARFLDTRVRVRHASLVAKRRRGVARRQERRALSLAREQKHAEDAALAAKEAQQRKEAAKMKREEAVANTAQDEANLVHKEDAPVAHFAIA